MSVVREKYGKWNSMSHSFCWSFGHLSVWEEYSCSILKEGRDFSRWKDKESGVKLISHKGYMIDNRHIIDANTLVS